MMQISVTSNLRHITRNLDDFAKKRIPGVTAGALDDAAFAVRKEIVTRTYPESFTVRNKRFASAMFRVGKASKSNLVATVSDVLGRDYMTMQAEGGIKRPRGNNIAIPSRQIKRIGTGRVPKSKEPRNLLNGKGYRTKLRSGQPVIAQSVGRGKSKRQQVLYILEQSARIPKRFRFYEDGRRVAQKTFPRHFNARMARAIARAKARVK